MKEADRFDIPGLIEEQAENSFIVRPSPGREEPALWVSKLAVYKQWPPSSENLMRQIFEFRRGLNIVWAKSLESDNPTARLSGHGAGKTTLCRLIRYVLGEEPAGNRGFREAFRAKFENGWVLGEVVVSGQVWLVGRSLGAIGSRPFAISGGSLEATPFEVETPPKGGFKEFLSAIELTVFGAMKIRTLADSHAQVDWARLLPWLTRDQEAHFGGLLNWRHKESDSNSPELSADDRAHLVRLMLGLIDEEEQKLAKAFTKASREHEQTVKNRAHYEFAVARDRQLLEAEFGIKVIEADDILLIQLMRQQVEALRQKYRESPETVMRRETIAKLTSDLVTNRATKQNLDWSTDDLIEHFNIVKARIEKVTAPPSPNRKLINSLGPLNGYCPQPMNKAWRERCPLAMANPPDNEFSKKLNAVAQNPDEQDREQLRDLEGELTNRQGHLNGLSLEIQKIEASLAAENSALRVAEDNNPFLGKAIELEVLVRTFSSGAAELQRLDAALQELKKKKDELTADLDRLTKSHRILLEQFSDIFNKLAKHLLGPVVTGSVKFSGKSISPEIQYDGDRDSAAFKVVRWLAFDLASLALGMANSDTFHPRFLIHDSPRESDLSPSIYSALFTAAHLLEKGSQTPAFQYIVTTTQEPPKELQKSPWLISPILDASTEGGRLLGVNL